MMNTLNEYNCGKSFHINANFEKFTMSLLKRIENQWDKTEERNKAITGISDFLKKYNKLNELIATGKNQVDIYDLKRSLKLKEQNNTIQTTALMDNMSIMYRRLQTSKEDRGSGSGAGLKGDDPYLFKERGRFKVEVAIRSICKHGSVEKTNTIKVRSYFNTNFEGNFVKGSPNYPEYYEILGVDKKNIKNNQKLINTIKKIATRELKEELLLDLLITDANKCSIFAFGKEIKCIWNYNCREQLYKGSKYPTIFHTVNINMDCNQYNELKEIIKKNSGLIQEHIEANSEVSHVICE